MAIKNLEITVVDNDPQSQPTVLINGDFYGAVSQVVGKEGKLQLITQDKTENHFTTAILSQGPGITCIESKNGRVKTIEEGPNKGDFLSYIPQRGEEFFLVLKDNNSGRTFEIKGMEATFTFLQSLRNRLRGILHGNNHQKASEPIN